ncbi:Rad52/22 family double-strand break repair protein-domain-containing protein [Hygrophoropsis aurantiaca]|uniref:Rad52/22 family double-strand break repair protein-domain-containing protein n=1 Tax=Hygrophoropsis aurantiaca TaxID=72124 RepID=A0ACB8AK57_9AGAM|nr:Rad52/22 family double-strand break repair protein-domain-containing protein [Hygrophoropsis aurantiaca]
MSVPNFTFSPTPFSPAAFSPSAFPISTSDPFPSHSTANDPALLQAKLTKKLGPEFLSQRPGPGGGPKLTYAEGWKLINLANEVFGYNGWSSSVVNLHTDFLDSNEETRRCSVGVSAIVRVTLRDGTFHEDTGYGAIENAKGKGAALDKCKKEAVTDALKRALRNFGNLLGNCLYDKSYASEVVKIKVPPVSCCLHLKSPIFVHPQPPKLTLALSTRQFWRIYSIIPRPNSIEASSIVAPSSRTRNLPIRRLHHHPSPPQPRVTRK